MPWMQWLKEAETIYDIPGLGWTRGKAWHQLAMGLLCGGNFVSLIVLLFFREPNPKTFILLFVRPNIPLLVSMLLAMASILVLTGLFSMAFISFAWAFYSWVGNALHMLLPWGAHRFRALAMAFFYTWAFATFLNILLFILHKTELGSHLFVVFYTGTGFDFMYRFIAAPGFFLAAAGVVYPALEVLCHLSGSHQQATETALLQNNCILD